MTREVLAFPEAELDAEEIDTAAEKSGEGSAAHKAREGRLALLVAALKRKREPPRRGKIELAQEQVSPEEWERLLQLSQGSKLREILEALRDDGNQVSLKEFLEILPTPDDLVSLNQFFYRHKVPYRLAVLEGRTDVPEWKKGEVHLTLNILKQESK